MACEEAVCLFRDFDQVYLDLFNTKYKTFFIELIKIVPHNESHIEKIFMSEEINKYDSLVITSRNTVSILENISKKHNLSKLSHISTYIISEKNMNNLPFKCKRVISGNGYATDLCNKMKKDIDDGKVTNVLFLCGNKRLNTIPNFLNKHGIKFDELKIYDTIHLVSEKIEKQIKNIINEYKKTYLVFFSPTGIESFKKIFSEEKNNEIWNNNKVKFVSIGTTTAKPLEKINKKVIIAHLPEDKYIFECISK